MATIDCNTQVLSLRFTRMEKFFGVGVLRDLDVPRDAITSVTVEPDGLRAARGIRAPGLAVPGRRKIGAWRRRGHRAAVSVRRGEPALSLALRGTRWDQLLIGTDDAESLAARLRGDDQRGLTSPDS